MKKIGLSFATILMSISLAFSQPVSDMGIIPIGVTLNSILRLNIVKGGNIEFVVNTVDQYTNGIANAPLYTTSFNVASSIDFDVIMYADAATLIGSDNQAHVMPLDNIGYVVAVAGGGVEGTAWDIPTIVSGTTAALTNVNTTTIIEGIDNAAAGDILKNAFDIQWELGTSNTNMNAASLLVQSLPADRYAVSVYLILQSN